MTIHDRTGWPYHRKRRRASGHPSSGDNILFNVSHVNRSPPSVWKCWLTQGRSAGRETLLPATGFLHINGAEWYGHSATLTFDNTRKKRPHVVKSLLTNALEQFKIQRSRLDIGILCNPAEYRHWSWKNSIKMRSCHRVQRNHVNIYVVSVAVIFAFL